ncbi:uncharacterized protein RHO25_010267 [Cercospora beticola]|uniref:AAA+ ATPase domain-containing protein n=1 Tax=Cercospora beticola TaxID=122368 RepID=A0ABZ0P1Y1_CERBT|nr:hypothetical protein RHO25_010267 [Cercospora beticola]
MTPTDETVAGQASVQDNSSENDYINVDELILVPPQQIIQRDEYWDKKDMCWKLVEPKLELKSNDQLQPHVLLVRRVFDKNMNPTHTEVDVNGPVLRGTLINIFRDSPGFPLTARKRTLKPEWFFWALNDLQNVAAHCRDVGDDGLFEIEAGLLFIAQHHPIILAELSQLSITTMISYHELWAIYAPNTLIYGKDPLEQERVWRVIKAASECKQDGQREFRIEAEYSEADGYNVGLVSTILTMPVYEGSVSISTLAYRPLHLLPQREQIWNALLARADKQLSFLRSSCKIQEHEGEGVVFGTPDTTSWEQKEPRRFYFRGRVMIDPVKYRAVEQAPLIPQISRFREFSHEAISMVNPDGRAARLGSELLPRKAAIDAEDIQSPIQEDPDLIFDPFASLSLPPPPPPPFLNFHTGDLQSSNQPLSEQELEAILSSLRDTDKTLFSGLLFGFSLTDARWAAFSTSDVSNITWRKDMLSSLVISAPVLTSMRQLIQSHSSRAPFDDFVPGKGQGLIGLFSGQPGLGKTFTAEAIAETAEKPLYSISSGALGSAASDINTNLRQIMNLCAHWQAVLLLDEADVFLAKRNIYDLERNAIVSVFLRELEYYPGIMILTTNQPEIIDAAFQSRIHFCYRYPALDWRARRQVWLQFIEKAEISLGADRVNVDGAGLSELADLDYNGRQIKNAVSIAMTLAGGKEGKVLSTDSILEVARTLQAFDFSAPGTESDVDD